MKKNFAFLAKYIFRDSGQDRPVLFFHFELKTHCKFDIFGEKAELCIAPSVIVSFSNDSVYQQ